MDIIPLRAYGSHDHGNALMVEDSVKTVVVRHVNEIHT